MGVDISAGVRQLLGREAQQEGHHIRPLALPRGMEGVPLETQAWTRTITTAAGPRRQVRATNGAPASGATSRPRESRLARPQEAGGRILGTPRRKVTGIASLGSLVDTGPAQTLLEDSTRMDITGRNPRALAGGRQRMAGQRCGGAAGQAQVAVAHGCMVTSAEEEDEEAEDQETPTTEPVELLEKFDTVTQGAEESQIPIGMGTEDGDTGSEPTYVGAAAAASECGPTEEHVVHVVVDDSDDAGDPASDLGTSVAAPAAASDMDVRRKRQRDDDDLPDSAKRVRTRECQDGSEQPVRAPESDSPTLWVCGHSGSARSTVPAVETCAGASHWLT